MKLVYSAPLGVTVHHAKNILESHGVPCQVLGEARALAAGELPMQDAWVELWVLRDYDEEKARSLLAPLMSTAAQTPQLRHCPACGADIEGPFDACWRCGADLPT